MYLSPGDVANIASATATAVATAVALYFGLDSNKRAKEEAKMKADLAAARTSRSLRILATKMSEFRAMYAFEDKTLEQYTQQSRHFASLRQYFEKPHYHIPLEQLLMLCALPNKAAHRIARAFDIIEQVRKGVMDDGIQGLFGDSVAFEKGKNRVPNWYPSIVESSELLEVALRELEEASNIGAPNPTGEELFGPPVSGE